MPVENAWLRMLGPEGRSRSGRSEATMPAASTGLAPTRVIGRITCVCEVSAVFKTSRSQLFLPSPSYSSSRPHTHTRSHRAYSVSISNRPTHHALLRLFHRRHLRCCRDGCGLADHARREARLQLQRRAVSSSSLPLLSVPCMLSMSTSPSDRVQCCKQTMTQKEASKAFAGLLILDDIVGNVGLSCTVSQRRPVCMALWPYCRTLLTGLLRSAAPWHFGWILREECAGMLLAGEYQSL